MCSNCVYQLCVVIARSHMGRDMRHSTECACLSQNGGVSSILIIIVAYLIYDKYFFSAKCDSTECDMRHMWLSQNGGMRPAQSAICDSTECDMRHSTECACLSQNGGVSSILIIIYTVHIYIYKCTYTIHIYCLLSTIYYLLPTIHYFLSTIYYLISIYL